MKITAQLSGLEDVKRRLESIHTAMRKQILRKATTAGGQILAKEVKQRAPKETGLLRKSIGYKVRSYNGGERFLAVVGPRSMKEAVVSLGGVTALARSKKGKALAAAGGEQGYRNSVRYAHLQELGWSGGAAQPFMRPAISAAHDRIVEAMRVIIEAGITAALSSAT